MRFQGHLKADACQNIDSRYQNTGHLLSDVTHAFKGRATSPLFVWKALYSYGLRRRLRNLQHVWDQVWNLNLGHSMLGLFWAWKQEP